MEEYVAKTLEEALQKASEEKNLPIDQLIYIEKEEKKGLFSKKVVVEVYDLADVVNFIKEYLVNGCASFDIEAEVNVSLSDEDIINVELNSSHNSVLIGKNGSTLQALNELTKLAVSSRFKRRFRILLDISGYKEEKYRKVVSIARRAARDVQKTRETATLDPMTPDERRMVHQALSSMSHVKTESIGDRNNRRITISYIE